MPPNSDSSITHLQNAVHHIFSWTTANLLTLYSSKTAFLLIKLKKQLAEIHNSPLNTTHSARNLGFAFDEHLTFSHQKHLSPNPAIIIFVNSAESTLTLISKQLLPLPPPSFTLSSFSLL